VAVALEGVRITFDLPDGGTYQAVDATDLAVRGDEFVAIVGPTGCGKSTLLNAAAGLLKPASGTVKIFGEPLTGLNRRAGYLFQQDSLMPWKTAIPEPRVSHGSQDGDTPKSLPRGIGR